jgi:peptide/nickel transport system ATP-binding protein
LCGVVLILRNLALFFHPRCPFAEPRCGSERQVVRDLGSDRQLRCWKAGELGPWPATPATARSRPLDHTADPLVRAVSLSKAFRTSGGLAALRLDLSGRGAPVRYRRDG